MKNPESDRLHSDEWDDHFRQRFADFQSEPPANALKRILADLPTPAPAISGRKTWLYGGLGAVLLLIGSWFVSNLSSPVAERLMATSVKTKEQAGTPPRKITNAPDGLATRSSGNQNSSQTGDTNQGEMLAAAKKAPSGNTQNAIASDNQNMVASDNRNSVALDNQKAGNQPATTSDNWGTVSPKPAVLATEKARSIGVGLSETTTKKSKTAVARAEQVKNSDTTLATSPRLEKTVPLSVQEVSTASQPTTDQVQSTSDQRLSVVKSGNDPGGTGVAGIDKPLASAEPSGGSLPPLTKDQTTALSTDSQVATNGWQPFSVAFLTNQPLRPLPLSLELPDVNLSAVPQSAPKQPTMSRLRPAVVVGVMPLYTYQQINPIQGDEVWIKNVKTQRALSAQRSGIQFQAGVEWPLGKHLSLRTSLIYSQLNQQVDYTTPSTKPDSIRVEVVDEKSVRIIPYYNDKQVTQQINWHYVGAGADFVLHLGKIGAWRNYASVGASAGIYMAQGGQQKTQPLPGFVQASYGLERQLTPSVWLRIAPTVQYGLSTLTDSDGLFRVRPYTYGLTIGLRR